MKGVVVTGKGALAISDSCPFSLMITQIFHSMEEIPQAMDLFLNHDRDMIKSIIYND